MMMIVSMIIVLMMMILLGGDEREKDDEEMVRGQIQLLESACSFVRPSVRPEKIPHHRYMHQGQRSWIYASFIPASYTHASGSKIIDICIIHTCIRVKDRGS